MALLMGDNLDTPYKWDHPPLLLSFCGEISAISFTFAEGELQNSLPGSGKWACTLETMAFVKGTDTLPKFNI